MIDTNRPKPPAHLSAESATFWSDVNAEHELVDAHHQQLLVSACEMLDRAGECRKVLEKDGLTITTPSGALKEHPCVAAERSSLNAFRLLLREIGLDHADGDAVRLPRGANYVR